VVNTLFYFTLINILDRTQIIQGRCGWKPSANPKVPTGDTGYSFQTIPTAPTTASFALPVVANGVLRLARVLLVPPRLIRVVSGAYQDGKRCIEQPSFLSSCWLGRVGSMGVIKLRTSQLDPCVPISVYTAPDILRLLFCSCGYNRGRIHELLQDCSASNYHDFHLHGADVFFLLL
jgi:hypothetical protein